MKILYCIFVIAVVSAAAGTPEEKTILQAGASAPTFSLPTLSNTRISLRSFCGDTLLKPHLNKIRHIVVLSFWATYCKPCQKEIPELMNFMNKHTQDSIKVFAVSIDKEGASKVGPFVKEKGYTLPILLDPYHKTAERYGVRSLPSLLVIDEKGIIRYSSTGFDENDPLDQKLEKIITSIRQGKTITPDSNGKKGESVAAEPAAASSDAQSTMEISPKNRWDAIVAVECGMSLDVLADSLGVSQQEIRNWYTDLKKAAIALWEKETSPQKQ